MQYIAYALALILPLIVLFVIYSLDLYQQGGFKWVMACFAWGVVAFFIARQVNRFVYFRGLVSLQDIPRYFAPVAEELLKALFLFYLVRRPNFTYFVDGAIYGFAAGMGFAIFENFEYIMANPTQGMGTAIARVISVNLVHASATASVGIALGLSRFRRRLTLSHFFTVLGGFAVAILLHGIFNNVVTRMTGGPVLLVSTIIGLAGVGFIAGVIFMGLKEQRGWIEQSLGVADGVTDSEAKVVQNLADAQTLLEPLIRVYGPEKAAEVERFLILQARLGIKRNTLEKLPDEKMRRAVEREMEQIRAEMDQARRAVGSYVMASVRLIFPPNASPVFDLLQRRIDERIAARPAGGGPNLFASLGKRISEEQSAPPPGEKPGEQSSGQ